MSLLLHQCRASHVRLSRMVCEMGGEWPVSCSLCFLAFFKTARFISVQVVHPYGSIDTATAWKKSCLILSERSDFYMIDNLSIALHTLPMRMLRSLWVDKTTTGFIKKNPIEPEAVFTKTHINYKWNVNFFQNSSFNILMGFFWAWSTFKTYFRGIFNAIHIVRSKCWD